MITKLSIIAGLLFGYYLVTNRFPPFVLLIVAVVLAGMGNTHLWGKKREGPSAIEKWYGVEPDNKE